LLAICSSYKHLHCCCDLILYWLIDSVIVRDLLGAQNMIGRRKLSIVEYLCSLVSYSFLPKSRFYWLLLISSTPLLFGASAGASIAAPQQKLAQVVVGASVNRPTLKMGSKGVPVRELQGALKLLGFYKGEVDGTFAEATRKAVSGFQQAAGLKSDGVVDNNTWQALFPSTTASPQVTNASAPPPSIDSFPMPTEAFGSVRVVNNSTQQQRRITPAVNNSVRVVQPAPEPKPSTPSSRNTEPKPAPPKPRNTTRKPKPAPAQRQAATTRTRQTTRTRSSTTTKKKAPVIQYTAQGLPILRPGMRGSQVVKLQEKLSTLGLLKGVDGDFGPVTLEAVKAFQKSKGLEPDGVVGGATWNLLNKR
jgi:peptidoglycan hydrolase-like protein with peptidoglycan-binding domain